MLTIKEGVALRCGGGSGAARGVPGVPMVADAELEAQRFGCGGQHGGRVEHCAEPQAVAAGQKALQEEKMPPKNPNNPPLPWDKKRPRVPVSPPAHG